MSLRGKSPSYKHLQYISLHVKKIKRWISAYVSLQYSPFNIRAISDMKNNDISKAYNFKKNNDLVTSSGTIINVNLESLSNKNYEVVINLLPDEAEYSRKSESEDFAELGIEYVYIPIDWESPKNSDFKAFEAAMIKSKGKKIHIHCAANFRATAFYAIFAFKHQNWSIEKTNEFIGSIWQLSEHNTWNKFVTEHIT